MADRRDDFYYELKERLDVAGIRAIVKTSEPAGGKCIKLNGVALFKILDTSNPYKNLGVAIYRKLTDTAIAKLGGQRVKGKNDWVRAPLTETNSKLMMDILFSVAERANHVRNRKMSGARKVKGKEPDITLTKTKASPKKRKIKTEESREQAVFDDNKSSLSFFKKEPTIA